MNNTSPTLWVVQTNLGNAETHDAIRQACERNGLGFRGVAVIPFSRDLPTVDHTGPILAYGATKFIKAVVDNGVWKPGAFFNERVFTMSNCLDHWANWMVNSDARVLRFDAVASLGLAGDALVFVRPNGDLKEFAGEVMTFAALTEWVTTIESGGFTFDGSLPVVVAEPKAIKAEWRVFAVEGPRVIAASRYRLDGRLSQDAAVPVEVIQFVLDRLIEWMPAPAVALDVANVNGQLRILELSDVHSTGHYAADISAIVVEIAKVAERHWRPNR